MKYESTNTTNSTIFRDRGIINKYFEIFLARCSLALKENKEYKINLYGYIFSDTIVFLAYVIFFSVLGEIIFEIVGFNMRDYILYLFLLFISAKTMWSFALMNFKDFLLSGNLNMYLVRPVNSYLLSSMNHLKGATIPILMFIIILTIYTIFKYNYTNIFTSLIIFVLGCIYFVVWINFFNSLAFFIKNAHLIHETINRNLMFIVEQFTPKMFEETIFRVFVYVLPSIIGCFVVIESLKGKLSEYVGYLYWILGIFILFAIGTWVLWHYGLKKYEAFG